MRRQDGVFGPYQHRQRWRLLVREGGNENTYSYATEDEARRVKRSLQRRFAAAASPTVGTVLIEYQTYLRVEKENKPTSIKTTMARLRSFFTDEETPIITITAKSAATLYQELVSRQAADTHRNTLAEARTFIKWCQKKGHMKQDILASVEGTGKRKKGKPQLRVDEARSWMGNAIDLANRGEVGAVAALLTLLLGVRANEIVTRQVRDVDDRGRLLWIPDSKTEAGRRTLEVPPVLRPYLLALTEGRDRTDLLFGRHWRDWPREWVQRICRRSRVPVVTAHGMRGLHATLAMSAGTSGHVVAASLGHESVRTTLANYADRQVLDQAARSKVASRLTEEAQPAG